jgi:hypothetical protein
MYLPMPLLLGVLVLMVIGSGWAGYWWGYHRMWLEREQYRHMLQELWRIHPTVAAELWKVIAKQDASPR